VNALTLALGAWGVLAAGFAAAYLLARRLDNYGIVDVAWSYAFAGIAFGYAFFGTGWPVRRALIAAMVLVWSLRLGTHILARLVRHHPREDARYAQLRSDWAGRFGPTMFGFFQLQALSVVLLAYPFLCACVNPAVAVGPTEAIGFAVWIVGLSGEALADHQLRQFRDDPAARGQVCDRGLWRYSRHPNYFFEGVIWTGYFLFAVGSPWGWIGAFSPLCILFLLLRVTGIPLAEAQSLRSKGDLYRRYQERTSAFIPWFPAHDRRSP
jgi:steroid 5-alpha reductase family enzyme